VAINYRGAEFMGAFGEMTGHKSGLALTETQFRDLFADGGYEEVWPTDPDSWLRIRPEKVEEIFAFVLARLGAGPQMQIVHPLVFVYHRVKDDPKQLAVYREVAASFNDYLRAALDDPSTKKIDPVPFVRMAAERHGEAGLRIALMVSEAMIGYQQQDPWSRMRRVDWEDVRQLDELFSSEHLASPHGTYFDERFANFLAVNFEEIDRINWRQFEGLAAEFFLREGYAVKLGPGRNDDGVDIRLEAVEETADRPTVVLVQCKRQRRAIDKTIVKALWADIDEEGANSGFIVTTSRLSPGARSMRAARGYPIIEADRPKLREFVDALKTPGTGIYLGE
jgi:restriction system protein